MAGRRPALQWRKLARQNCLRGRAARYVAAAALCLVAACGCCLAMLLPLTTLCVRGTSWHSDVFCNVSKVVLRGRRNTFVTFSEDVLQFSWQAQHFGRVHRHFSWQAQHFRRVVLRVFCKSHWQGCVKWRQGANSVAGVAFCAMCWKLTEASHETSILMLPIFGF